MFKKLLSWLGFGKEKKALIKYGVMIIGAGSIGALKSNKLDHRGGENILTMAHAIDEHPQLELCDIIDSNLPNSSGAWTKWGRGLYRVYESIKFYMLSNYVTPDIIYVGVPTSEHEKVMKEILQLTPAPQLVICEKPFGEDIAAARRIRNAYNKRNIPIMVNYQRRFDESVKEIKFDTTKIKKIVVTYTGDFKENCCHAIDLFYKWFGDNLYANPGFLRVQQTQSDNNFFTIDFHQIENDYSCFEFDIWTEKCRILYTEHGNKLIFIPVHDNGIYGNKQLSWDSQMIFKTHLNRALLSGMENAVQFLEGKADLLSTSFNAIETHKILGGI